MIYKNEHLDLDNRSVFHHVVFEPPLRVMESMKDEACYVFSVNGRAEVYGGEAHQSLSEQEGMLMKCGRYVNKWQKVAGQDRTEIFIIKLYPDVLRQIYQDGVPETVKKASDNPTSVVKVEVDQMIESYIQSIQFYFQNPSLVNDELVMLKVKELIFLLINTDRFGTVNRLLADLFNPDSFAIREVVAAHLYDDLSLEDLASLCSMSLSSFKRKFKEAFDDTPKHYITAQRLTKACKLLESTAKSVSEISYDCGFNDPGYFTKVFRSQYDLTPREYRMALEQR